MCTAHTLHNEPDSTKWRTQAYNEYLAHSRGKVFQWHISLTNSHIVRNTGCRLAKPTLTGNMPHNTHPYGAVVLTHSVRTGSRSEDVEVCGMRFWQTAQTVQFTDFGELVFPFDHDHVVIVTQSFMLRKLYTYLQVNEQFRKGI